MGDIDGKVLNFVYTAVILNKTTVFVHGYLV